MPVADLHESPTTRAQLAALSLAALGVVYGDIGTSPIYAMRESLHGVHGVDATQVNVLGLLSLILWALILVISVKYLLFVMRADNGGEGGMIALTALVTPASPKARRRRRVLVLVGLFGASLLYGDGMITPAISVLSAVEGLEVVTPVFRPYVVPLTIAILIGLFMVQRRGTAKIGAIFGPVMLLWFATLGLLGLAQIVKNPSVLAALDPRYALGLFEIAGWQAFVALGAIVLAVTGAEALYADMGHFGPLPIRVAWFGLVLPGLVLNYFGQGALLLRSPEALEHPFYHLAPSWLLFPLIGLATCATIIASQAVISGVFSLTRQAVRLGHLSRMTILHTSTTEIGQIYIPRVNWMLMAGVLLIVFIFGSSSNLAAAYGISVTGAMAIDTVLVGLVAATRWGWGVALAGLVFGLLLLADLGYLAANALKIPSGGWLPLAVAAAFIVTVLTWRRGRSVLHEKLYGHGLTVRAFIDKLDPTLIRVPGTAVFMTGHLHVVPMALLHNLRHNKVLHEQVVLMTARARDVPHVPAVQRVTVEKLSKGFYRVMVSHGFMDEPDIPGSLELCRTHGLSADPQVTSFFLCRETLVPSPRPEMNPFEERLFILLSAGNQPATAYFGIPPDQVVELGIQIEV
jgi:KUP system potassium uptake protein